jgi:hypothetical protein
MNISPDPAFVIPAKNRWTWFNQLLADIRRAMANFRLGTLGHLRCGGLVFS